MNKLLAASTAAALMVAISAVAYAAESTGTIKAIDEAKKTVTLEDDAVYVLPASVDPATLKVGEAVMITFEQDGDKNVATQITK